MYILPETQVLVDVSQRHSELHHEAPFPRVQSAHDLAVCPPQLTVGTVETVETVGTKGNVKAL